MAAEDDALAERLGTWLRHIQSNPPECALCKRSDWGDPYVSEVRVLKFSKGLSLRRLLHLPCGHCGALISFDCDAAFGP